MIKIHDTGWDNMKEQALTGLTVIDLSQNIAGPYCTKLLADMGAKVIKIEQPGLGDPSRLEGPFPENKPDLNKSGLFTYLNNNKIGITTKSIREPALPKRLPPR